MATGDQPSLTAREREILKMMTEGRTSKEIAGLLAISIRTVEHHRANILSRLNLRKTTDLVRYAVQKRYV
jgi:DNA-binding CsgD family transcriptional regulator